MLCKIESAAVLRALKGGVESLVGEDNCAAVLGGQQQEF